MDPYDLIEPVNILPVLPKDFFEKVVGTLFILTFSQACRYTPESEHLRLAGGIHMLSSSWAGFYRHHPILPQMPSTNHFALLQNCAGPHCITSSTQRVVAVAVVVRHEVLSTCIGRDASRCA